MKEQLTIADLAPHLPYGLEIEIQSSTHKSPFLTGLYRDNIYASSQGQNLSFKIKDIKPIMYPLSMLDKEIEHNGERFVPINRLNILSELGEYYINDLGWLTKNFKFTIEYNILDTPLEMIKKIQEYHFWTGDQTYFEKGLIIDKSKL